LLIKALKKYSLEHHRQQVLLLSIEDGSEDIQEQAILIAPWEVAQLGTLVSRGSGLDSEIGRAHV
jgi:hypothetical protein